MLEASEAVTVTVKVFPRLEQLKVDGETLVEVIAQLSVNVDVTSEAETVTEPLVPILAVKFGQTKVGGVKSISPPSTFEMAVPHPEPEQA